MILPFFIPHAGCPHQCVFCDQRRITGKQGGPEPSAVGPAVEDRLKAAPGREPMEVAFFGGTFTALPRERQLAYLSAVRPFITAGAVSGIRVSTRPDAVTPDVLALLKQHQVRTVELGVQSMDSEVLRLSGRGHTPEDTVRASVLLREQGFLFGIQLMPGLPGDSPELFLRTVEQVIGLAPGFVRIYPALVIAGTPLERLYRDGNYLPLSLPEAVTLCSRALGRFREAGIAVIRIGLQPTEDLLRPGAVVAGPWHPAFGQLVESSLFLDRMRSLLAGSRSRTLRVHPRDLSTAIGQRKTNLGALRREFGRDVAILSDRTVAPGTIQPEELL